MKKAVFLDRDGLINRKAPDGQYVTRWEDFHVLPGVIESIAELNRVGLLVVVVTNQRCIAKGLMTEMDLQELHRQMSKHFAERGATFNAIYYCPHDLEPPCLCRKPAPGMLLDAARSHGLNLAACWMIGDSDSDIQAGRNAGCRTIRVSAEQEARHESSNGSLPDADILVGSLPEALELILQTSDL
ncbi:MAG TPA: HAD family hydrolase [Candidatus Solibacter sp.]|nr:HAD family hydrolase [Candidatus Solibacter sp.]